MTIEEDEYKHFFFIKLIHVFIIDHKMRSFEERNFMYLGFFFAFLKEN